MQTPFNDILITSYKLGQAMYITLSLTPNLNIGWNASFYTHCACSAGCCLCLLNLQMTINSYHADWCGYWIILCSKECHRPCSWICHKHSCRPCHFDRGLSKFEILWKIKRNKQNWSMEQIKMVQSLRPTSTTSKAKWLHVSISWLIIQHIGTYIYIGINKIWK